MKTDGGMGAVFTVWVAQQGAYDARITGVYATAAAAMAANPIPDEQSNTWTQWQGSVWSNNSENTEEYVEISAFEVDGIAEIVERWIVLNLRADLVPNDEGSTPGLVWNALQALHHGPQAYQHSSSLRYAYKPEQDAILDALCKKYGIDEL